MKKLAWVTFIVLWSCIFSLENQWLQYISALGIYLGIIALHLMLKYAMSGTSTGDILTQ
jgi:hypothetical protein